MQPTRWSISAALVFAATFAVCSAQTQPAAPRRVVSFSPALTQIAEDLGRADWIVAVAAHDDAAPPGVPQVGHYLAPNIEALLSVQPDLLLVMAGKEGVHPQLADLARRQSLRLVTVSVPHTVQEVLQLIRGQQCPDDLADALSAQIPAQELADRLEARLALLRHVTASIPSRRVLLVINANPLWASGPGSVEDDLLSYLGATNALGEARTAAVAVDRERLLAAQPQVIVLLSANAPPLGPLESDSRLAPLRGLDIPAVRARRIVLLSNPRVMLLQSSALMTIAVDLARAIHPELAERLDAAFASPLPPSPETQP